MTGAEMLLKVWSGAAIPIFDALEVNGKKVRQT